MRSSFLEKLLERAPRVGAAELQTHLSRLAEEKGFLETLFNTLQEGLFIQKQILFVLVKMLERQELTAEERESLLSTFRWQGRN